MQEKTIAAQQKSASLESNEKMPSMAPPAFGLTASSGGGGAPKGMQKVEQNGTPFDVMPIQGWPGEVCWIHSPCFSQEIQALGLQAQGNPAMYQSASSEIGAKIDYCRTNPFKNAEGVVNTYAKDRLEGTVPLNKENMAATCWGSGWPKLVVLTSWKEPSKREQGGVNYSYLFYFPFEALAPKDTESGWSPPGGFIAMGDGGPGIDLGHKVKGAVEINEWFPALVKAFGSAAGFSKDNPNNGKMLSDVIKRFMEKAQGIPNMEKKGEDIRATYDEIVDENKKEEQRENEKHVTIGDQKFQKGKTYTFKTKDPITHKEGSVSCTPEYYLNVHFKNGSRLLPGQGE